MVYAKRLSNLGLIHLVNQAFDRLKTALSMYDSDDMPYTRMHFKTVEEEQRKQCICASNIFTGGARHSNINKYFETIGSR